MPTYLLTGGTVATYTDKNAPLAFKADILVENSIISQIGKNISVPGDVEIIDCSNKWITPGFIDTHRHTWMAVMRASQCDWLLSEYIVKNTWSMQTAMTADQVRVGQLAGCLDALHSGVTTILDHFHATYSPEVAEASLEATIQSGARVIWAPSRWSPATQLLPTLTFEKEEETLQWQLAKLKEWGKNGGKLSEDGRVTLGLGYDVGDFGDAQGHRDIINLARSIPVAVITAHVASGPRILTYQERGLLGPDVVLSHCTELAKHTEPDDEMWAAMKKSGASIASTPEDEMGMAHGNPVAFEAVERGIKCGLGVDCTSINSGDIFTQMRFALQFHRARQHEHVLKNKLTPPSHNKFTSADAFRLGTLGGAEALNLSHLVGTVEVGKKADLVIFDALSANLAGATDPFQGVVFHASNADVETVFVNGEIVKRNGVLTKVPWGPVALELKKRAQEIRDAWPEEKLEKRWMELYNHNNGNLNWLV